jgi:hypothetical protein
MAVQPRRKADDVTTSTTGFNEGLRPPRWDGRRILFEVLHAGSEVACAISPEAVRDIARARCFTPADLLRNFAAARPRIEAAAASKLRQRAIRMPGPLTVWSGDVGEADERAAGPDVRG